MFLVTDRESFSWANLVRSAIMALLAFVFSPFGITGPGDRIVHPGFLLLTLGVPVNLIVAWNEQRAAARLVAPGAVQVAQAEA
jgi:hypothetical protein